MGIPTVDYDDIEDVGGLDDHDGDEDDDEDEDEDDLEDDEDEDDDWKYLVFAFPTTGSRPEPADKAAAQGEKSRHICLIEYFENPSHLPH